MFQQCFIITSVGTCLLHFTVSQSRATRLPGLDGVDGDVSPNADVLCQILATINMFVGNHSVVYADICGFRVCILPRKALLYIVVYDFPEQKSDFWDTASHLLLLRISSKLEDEYGNRLDIICDEDSEFSKEKLHNYTVENELESESKCRDIKTWTEFRSFESEFIQPIMSQPPLQTVWFEGNGKISDCNSMLKALVVDRNGKTMLNWETDLECEMKSALDVNWEAMTRVVKEEHSLGMTETKHSIRPVSLIRLENTNDMEKGLRIAFRAIPLPFDGGVLIAFFQILNDEDIKYILECIKNTISSIYETFSVGMPQIRGFEYCDAYSEFLDYV